MIVITSLEELEQINKSAVTIGKFDGLHKGHKALIEDCRLCKKIT